MRLAVVVWAATAAAATAGAPKLAPVDTGNCVERDFLQEAACAGKVAALKGIVSTLLETGDRETFKALGAGELAARIAVTLKWNGGDPDQLGHMERPAGPEAKSICSR
jgi:hypothetical protein